MGAQFCVALLRLKRLTGLYNHQHLLDLENDIMGTQTKVARLVKRCCIVRRFTNSICVVAISLISIIACSPVVPLLTGVDVTQGFLSSATQETNDGLAAVSTIESLSM